MSFESPSTESQEEIKEREGARVYVEVKNALLQINPDILNSAQNADRKEDLKRQLQQALEQLGG